ncbi:hypothetical protein [Fundidesulfovibrio agrisoli]|uniref:hypothetical protein n=1 Tax=Fundidesulfovibrio agrisoli TaxID=2922717 RepID=UPI001FAC0535|nr:hypothetical protein [Fundidesulfovibrio agrisoli]
MNGSPDQLRQRRMRCEELAESAALQLESLRDALDAGGMEDSTRLAREAEQNLRELAALTLLPEAANGLEPGWSDPGSLHAFRRAGLEALERLRARYAALCAGPWQDAGDILGRDSARRLALRTVCAMLAAAAIFGGWWRWQEARNARLAAGLARVRAETALEAVRLIGRAWTQAARFAGKTPADVPALKDFDVCLGTDLRLAAPDAPCRQAWKAASEQLFTGAVPPPGNADAAPSEVQRDPWGSPYVLSIDPQGRGRVASPGPDGRLGTPDDISETLP